MEFLLTYPVPETVQVAPFKQGLVAHALET